MSRERGINTVVDVSLAVLFISIAVLALSMVPVQSGEQRTSERADRTADILASSTAGVTYSMEEAAETAVDGDLSDAYPNVELERTTHGSLASLIASLAVANATIESSGDQIRPPGEKREFARVLDERLQTALVETSVETHVRAVWEPYDGAPLAGETTVGQRPPRDVSTTAATVKVPSGFESVPDASLEPIGEESYRALSEIIAETVVEGYLPQAESKRVLEGSDLEQALALERYRQMATAIESVDTAEKVLSEIREPPVRTATANEVLTELLADQFEADLRRSFDSVTNAVAAIDVNTVTIVVKTWEA